MVVEAILNEAQKNSCSLIPRILSLCLPCHNFLKGPIHNLCTQNVFKSTVLQYLPQIWAVPACAAVWKQTSAIFIVGAQTRQGQILCNRVFYLAYNNNKLLNHSLAESLTLKQAKEHEDGTF